MDSSGCVQDVETDKQNKPMAMTLDIFIETDFSDTEWI
jgi:hypothetical protein